MKKKTKLIILGLIILSLLSYGFIYIYSLSKIQISNFEINNIKNISLSGFTLEGNIEIQNKGIVPVEISYIEYSVILESNEKELTKGRIKGGKTNPRKKENYLLSTKINWIPTAQIAWETITSKTAKIKIAGNVHVADFKIFNFKIPFSETIDIEPYIKQFAKEKIHQAMQKIEDTTKNILRT
jgi:hypothetical protein